MAHGHHSREKIVCSAGDYIAYWNYHKNDSPKLYPEYYAYYGADSRYV